MVSIFNKKKILKYLVQLTVFRKQLEIPLLDLNKSCIKANIIICEDTFRWVKHLFSQIQIFTYILTALVFSKHLPYVPMHVLKEQPLNNTNFKYLVSPIIPLVRSLCKYWNRQKLKQVNSKKGTTLEDLGIKS